MKMPKRLRLIVACECREGEFHRIGMTRAGTLVILDHSPDEIHRWEAFEKLGGTPPRCLLMARLDPLNLDSWGGRWERNDPSCNPLRRCMLQVGRVIRLRAERASARESHGQGKRNRKYGMLQPYVPPKPAKKPVCESDDRWRLAWKWRKENDGRVLSRYRRRKRLHDILYAPRSKKKRRHR